MRQKLIFLIADGMGDYPLPELVGKTPLQAANTPNLEYLAPKSIQGLCQTIPEGSPPGSDIANMALLGFDPLQYHTGRGPIEAAAQGLQLDPKDLVYRLNMCTVSDFSEQGTMLDYCAGHIETELARGLLNRLRQELPNQDLELICGMQYRHLLIQKNGLESREAGLNINPPHDILNQSLKQDLETYAQSQQLWDFLQNSFSLLKQPWNQSQANALWPWGQGGSLQLPDFHKNFQLKGAVISAVDLIKGLGRACGLQVLEVPGATGLLQTNYQGKANAARNFLQKGGFVYLHLEAPDECSHAGSFSDKIQAIQRFDQEILGPLLPELERQSIACLVACDHLTPISLRTHSPDPVPFLFYNPLKPAHNGSEEFSEKTAEQTGLLIEKGPELLRWVLADLEV
ncbi:MAG: 2,3-bisphosphoglycerate-independent phosphoglycerate mutase [Desulfohalobiaceae bacterium]